MALTCGLAGVPTALMYKTDELTFFLSRLVLKIPYLGMPNLLLNRLVMKEFVQTPNMAQKLAAELKRLKQDPQCVVEAQKAAREMREILSHPTRRTALQWAAEGLTK